MLAAGTGGLALAVIVGLDGSPSWQATRVAIVLGATALLAVLLSRCPARWRGRLAVTSGVPAVAVAVGFAPHWTKGGPVALQATSALLAVAGLALVVGGTVTATRGQPWWQRSVIGVVVFVAVAVVTFVAAPAVAATNVPRPAIGATPATVGLEYDSVTLPTPDGIELAGWFVESSNGAAVVLLHGAGSTRSDVLNQAAVLAESGFGVLMVDARGHGESGGRAMDFGWYGDADIAAATTYLATQPDLDPDRIGAVGMSMGGEEAIGSSGTNETLRAVVAEGATARTAADHAWLSKRYGVRGHLQEQVVRVRDRITERLTSASVPTSLRGAVASSGDTRYLLVTAANVADEGHAAADIASVAPDRVEIWTVPSANHTGGLATAPDEWTHRVIGFLNEALGE